MVLVWPKSMPGRLLLVPATLCRVLLTRELCYRRCRRLAQCMSQVVGNVDAAFGAQRTGMGVHLGIIARQGLIRVAPTTALLRWVNYQLTHTAAKVVAKTYEERVANEGGVLGPDEVSTGSNGAALGGLRDLRRQSLRCFVRPRVCACAQEDTILAGVTGDVLSRLPMRVFNLSASVQSGMTVAMLLHNVARDRITLEYLQHQV